MNEIDARSIRAQHVRRTQQLRPINRSCQRRVPQSGSKAFKASETTTDSWQPDVAGSSRPGEQPMMGVAKSKSNVIHGNFVFARSAVRTVADRGRSGRILFELNCHGRRSPQRKAEQANMLVTSGQTCSELFCNPQHQAQSRAICYSPPRQNINTVPMCRGTFAIGSMRFRSTCCAAQSLHGWPWAKSMGQSAERDANHGEELKR